ncbi:Transposase [Posidoniimonas polymericola]|uniref:Transposase n=1 Tax=Posidoniimonas polymericola TaxID=2528002 RepID=A0A5C5YG55_9BACT|nr:Transposase [Posidoniimonas polymericola]
MEPVVIGIDVSKEKLDVATPEGVSQWGNDPGGLQGLVRDLSAWPIASIILEATGGYERAAVAELAGAGLPVVVVNPRQVRDFARATGRLAKTDAIDAAVLAQFGRAVQPERRPLPSEKQLELQQRIARRRQLVGMLTTEKNRLQQTTSKLVRKTIQSVINTLHKHWEPLTSSCTKRFGRRPSGVRRRTCCRACPASEPKRRSPCSPSCPSWAAALGSRSPRWSGSPRLTTTAGSDAASGPPPAAGRAFARPSTWPPWSPPSITR